MADDRNEGDFADDGTEGSNVGFMRFEGTEEKSSKAKEEPEEELDQDEEDEEDLGEEEESEEDEDESGDDEEDEEDESILPKVSKELEKEREALLRAFTKKAQGISNIRLQAKLVDAIDKDPERVLKDLARRYNVTLGEKALSKEKKEFKAKEVEKLTPKEGEELPSFIQRAIAANFEGVSDMIKEAVEGALGGQETQERSQGGEQGMDEVAIQGVLSHLNATYSDWGLYEEKMIDIVTKHPSYMNDIDGLYEAAKSQSVNVRDKAKASKKGKKVKKERSGQRGSAVKITSTKGRNMTFDEGWEMAKRDLRKKRR